MLLQDDEKLKGEIVDADEDSVTLLLKYRKPKDIGKGKVDVEEERVVSFGDIKKAVIAVKF